MSDSNQATRKYNTLEEYKKHVHPGMKVHVVLSSNNKMHGVAGNMYDSNGSTPVIKFDAGIVRVTEKNVKYFILDALN